MPSDQRWDFDGDEIAPGRVALRRLGGGGEFEVYLVWDDWLAAAAAAKIVRPDRVDRASTTRRLSREADLLERFPHPGLPRCFDRALDAEAPHIVLELLDAPSLSRAVRDFGPMDAAQVVPTAVQVASVLQFLANNGRVHLDVKPGNIVMTAVPKLIDLSLARTVEAAAALEGVAGTPPYLSPEQCLASEGAKVGTPADVWGLGMAMYYALHDDLPFDAAEWSEVPSTRYPQVTARPRPPASGVPRRLAEVVMACLARDPDARPTAAEVMVGLESAIARTSRRRLPAWTRRPRS